MELTVEEKLLKHQIEVADGPITVDAGKLRILLFLKEDEVRDIRKEGYDEGFDAGVYQGVAQTRDSIREFADEL